MNPGREKLLFLDIDGVLNGEYDWEEIGRFSSLWESQLREFRARLLARMRRVLRETGATVVVISSKRKTWGPEGIRRLFFEAETGIEIGYVLPGTDSEGEDSDDRIRLIREFLSARPAPEQWAVVDDTWGYGWETDPEFAARTVIPDGLEGISESDVRGLIEILGVKE